MSSGSKTVAAVRSVFLVVALVIAAVVAGCGGSNSGDSQLVDLRVQAQFDFHIPGEPADQGAAGGSTTSTTIDDNGRGTRVEGGRSYGFTVGPQQLATLKDRLAALDLDELDHDFGATSNDPTTFRLTYQGKTITVGSRFDASATRSPDGRAFLSALGAIDDAARAGPSQPSKAVAAAERKARCVERADNPADCLSH
jgi:hypothetical protein